MSMMAGVDNTHYQTDLVGHYFLGWSYLRVVTMDYESKFARLSLHDHASVVIRLNDLQFLVVCDYSRQPFL